MKPNLVILVWANKSKRNSRNQIPLYLRLTVSGKRAEISLNEKVDIKLWDAKFQKVKGMSLIQAIAKHSDFFKADVMAMVSVAEQTNATAYIFDKLSHRYNNMLQRQSKTLSTFLEPIIILIVGVFVGFILVAMYLPMFKLSTVMG